MYKLFGDGIHDDTLAIQEMIDNANHELYLPMPDKCYIISKPLEIPSSFKFVLPRYAEIKLADQSNCVMLKNKTKQRKEILDEPKLMNSVWAYLCYWEDDFKCENIEISGGIWNCNNINQRGNPAWWQYDDPTSFRDCYNGFGMLFYNVKNITIRSLTVKDPVTFAITLDTVSYFTVEDIKFDFNYGNPLPANMDGVHVNGNSHFGTIRNLMGTCYDDAVALNADEGSCGPITNVEISGIYAEKCHSAVRLLCKDENIENVHIHDVYGTYYQYCIGITKFYPGEATAVFKNINIDNVYASKASFDEISFVKDGQIIYPLASKKECGDVHYSPIYFNSGVVVENISISKIHRCEEKVPFQTIWFENGSYCKNVSIYDVYTENKLGKPMPAIVNDAFIDTLHMDRIVTDGDEILVNNGTINKLNP